jgi:hypothetical protein
MSLTIPRAALFSLTSIVFIGGFSRFTHGAYTPSYYAYQLDRAPNNEHTWLIPVFDMFLGTLLLFAKTRPWSALLCALGQGVGIWMRIQEGKGVIMDCGLFSLTIYVFVSSTGAGVKWWRYRY